MATPVGTVVSQVSIAFSFGQFIVNESPRSGILKFVALITAFGRTMPQVLFFYIILQCRSHRILVIYRHMSAGSMPVYLLSILYQVCVPRFV